LALKVSCNSVYGFTGCTETGKLPCKPIAECTTTIGRDMIESSKQYAENLDNFKEIMQCVDYFPEDYPYIIKDMKKGSCFMGSAELLIKKLFKLGIDPNCPLEFYCVCNEQFQIFTDTGFQFVTGLLVNWQTHMYKFETPAGKVFSMQKYSCDVIYGDSVSADTPILLMNANDEVMIKTIDTIGENWSEYPQFKSDSIGRFDKLQTQVPEGLKVWTYDKTINAGKWTPIVRVIKHKTHKKMFRVLTHTGCVDVTEDHSLLDTACNIIKPTECKIGQELLHAPMPSRPLAKIPLPHNHTDTHETKDKLSAATFMYQCAVLGHACSIDTPDNDTFKISLSNKNTSNMYAIKKITPLPDATVEQYVYDLETEQGYFQAGIGDLIVKNTDSVFCNFDTTMQTGNINKVAYSMVIGAYVSDKITAYLRSFNRFKADKDKWCELEYEKVYGNLLLFTKKRYTGTLYEFNPLKYKYIDKKGIALKRRDYCDMVKDVYSGLLKILFDEAQGQPEQRISKACQVVKEMIIDLLKGAVAPEKLILSKSLRDAYKIREKKQAKGKSATFNPSNIFLKDHLVINNGLLGETRGVVIVKRQINTKDFFSANAMTQYPLELRIESCENDELLPTIDQKYANHQGLPFGYDDIISREAHEISLKQIIDPRTTEKELEPVTQAHVRLTRRMYLRDPGSAPVSGERVPYMFVEKKGNVLQHEKAEHPDYVKLHNLKPDPKYYLDNQLRKPIQQLFELLISDPNSLFDPLIREYQNTFVGQKELTEYFVGNVQPTVPKELASPDAQPKLKPKTKPVKQTTAMKRQKEIDAQQDLNKWFPTTKGINGVDGTTGKTGKTGGKSGGKTPKKKVKLV